MKKMSCGSEEVYYYREESREMTTIDYIIGKHTSPRHSYPINPILLRVTQKWHYIIISRPSA